MTKNEVMLSIPGQKMVHLRTEVIYSVERVFKLKVNGTWDWGMLYSNESGEEFCRPVNDFWGFAWIEDE